MHKGGFRLYSESYVYLCRLIRDLQLFGCTLDEIKAVSDDVRSLTAGNQKRPDPPPGESDA